MKKLLMMSVMAMAISAPALANDPVSHEQKAEKWFSKIDTNGDGQITKSEHDAFGNDMFSKADTDKNGSVSMAELKAQKMKEKEEMTEKAN